MNVSDNIPLEIVMSLQCVALRQMRVKPKGNSSQQFGDLECDDMTGAKVSWTLNKQRSVIPRFMNSKRSVIPRHALWASDPANHGWLVQLGCDPIMEANMGLVLVPMHNTLLCPSQTTTPPHPSVELSAEPVLMISLWQVLPVGLIDYIYILMQHVLMPPSPSQVNGWQLLFKNVFHNVPTSTAAAPAR